MRASFYVFVLATLALLSLVTGAPLSALAPVQAQGRFTTVTASMVVRPASVPTSTAGSVARSGTRHGVPWVTLVVREERATDTPEPGLGEESPLVGPAMATPSLPTASATSSVSPEHHPVHRPVHELAMLADAFTGSQLGEMVDDLRPSHSRDDSDAVNRPADELGILAEALSSSRIGEIVDDLRPSHSRNHTFATRDVAAQMSQHNGPDRNANLSHTGAESASSLIWKPEAGCSDSAASTMTSVLLSCNMGSFTSSWAGVAVGDCKPQITISATKYSPSVMDPLTGTLKRLPTSKIFAFSFNKWDRGYSSAGRASD
ncbi:hypothetical protein CLAIMM_05073 [Cladophialophora immunda]|nr:hypothetical protein CLAIMM_05073 [Cladophialophora immunda]